MHVRKIAWSSHSCWPVDRLKSSHLLLLPWCTAITGYHTSRKTSYNLWLATYEQEIPYRMWVSQGERKPPQMEWQFKYVNAILIVLCISDNLICAYIIGIYDKRIITSCTTWYLLQTIGVFWLLSSILSADYFAIIYAADIL